MFVLNKHYACLCAPQVHIRYIYLSDALDCQLGIQWIWTTTFLIAWTIRAWINGYECESRKTERCTWQRPMRTIELLIVLHNSLFYLFVMRAPTAITATGTNTQKKTQKVPTSKCVSVVKGRCENLQLKGDGKCYSIGLHRHTYAK